MSDALASSSGFKGLRVAAFESRRAPEMARLIERAGGRPHVSPSMREVPIGENREAIDFANRVITGQIDIIIFMTGVGIRHLLAEIERHVDRDRFLAAVSDVTTVARGPKPVAVLKELGLDPSIRVPEPNTWREVLATIDGRLPVAQQTVGLQEYGKPNASLIAGLEARAPACSRCGFTVGTCPRTPRRWKPISRPSRPASATWPCSLRVIKW